MIPFFSSPPNAMLISTKISLLNMIHLHKSTNIDFGGGAFSSFKSAQINLSPQVLSGIGALTAGSNFEQKFFWILFMLFGY